MSESQISYEAPKPRKKRQPVKKRRKALQDIEAATVRVDKLKELKLAYEAYLNSLIKEMTNTDVEWLQLCAAGNCGPTICNSDVKQKAIDVDNAQEINARAIDIFPSCSTSRNAFESDLSSEEDL